MRHGSSRCARNRSDIRLFAVGSSPARPNPRLQAVRRGAGPGSHPLPACRLERSFSDPRVALTT